MYTKEHNLRPQDPRHFPNDGINPLIAHILAPLILDDRGGIHGMSCHKSPMLISALQVYVSRFHTFRAEGRRAPRTFYELGQT